MTNNRMLVGLVVSFAAHGTLLAQNAQTLTDGKAFAESMVPTAPGQIVNPAGVNPSSWPSGATAMPTTMPPGLGAFSSPLTNSPLYGTAVAQGALSGLANAKIQNCQNYVPTGDPIADQECAAVKFMNKDCVPLTSAQAQITGTVGVPTATGVNCTDTYGAGQSNFGYRDAISASDPVFGLTQNAQHNASATTTQNCVSTPIVTKPAQYETNTCSKTVSTNLKVCSHELAVAVTTSYTPAQVSYKCDGGVLQGQYCVSTTSTPATATYSCPNGGTLNGSSCVSGTSVPATPYYSCESGELQGDRCVTSAPADGVPSCPPPEWSYTPANIWTMTYDANNVAWCSHIPTDPADPFGFVSFRAALTYKCADGGTLSGNTCTTTTTATLNYKCDNGTLSGSSCMTGTTTPASVTYTCASGTLSGSQCVTTTNTPPNTVYSCPSGASPVGGQCVTYSTQVNWINNCTPYEQSAGGNLGGPK